MKLTDAVFGPVAERDLPFNFKIKLTELFTRMIECECDITSFAMPQGVDINPVSCFLTMTRTSSAPDVEFVELELKRHLYIEEMWLAEIVYYTQGAPGKSWIVREIKLDFEPDDLIELFYYDGPL